MSFFVRGQSCYTIHNSFTGITSLYDDAQLDSAACALLDAIGSTDFKILGLDLYPVLAYTDPTKGYEQSFDKAYADADTAYSGFILTSKEIDVDSKIAYKIRIKWNALPVFSSFTAIEKATIENALNNLARAEYEERGESFQLNDQVEVEILKKFIFYLTEGVNASFFESAGFREVNFEGKPIIVSFDNINNIGTFVLDYAGVIDQASGNHIRVAAELAAQQTAFSPKLILTSHSTSVTSLDEAVNNYNNLNDFFILWIHFTSSSEAVYQVKANITLAEAKQIIDDRFALLLEKLDETAGGAVSLQTSGSRSLDCSQVGDCSDLEFRVSIFSWPRLSKLRKWSMYCCPNHYPSLASNDMNTATAHGLIDGLVQTLILIYDLGSGLNELFTHIPFTTAWMLESFERIYTEGSFRKAFADKFKDDVEFWSDIRTAVVTFCDMDFNWSSLASGVWQSLKDFLFKDLNPLVGGLKSTGYVIGKLAFDIIIELLTGPVPSGGIKKLTTFSLEAFRKLKTITTVTGIKTLAKDGIVTSARVASKLKCKILYGGCFVKDTPILMANKSYKTNFGNTAKALALAASMPIVAVPIQDVQLLDYALAHKTVNESYNLLASNNEETYLGLINADPYTSEQQKQRDQYELNGTDWYAVKFVQIGGSSICKLALHQHWISQNNYTTDAIVNLNLPEQGISGPFKITSIKHILPQKKPEDPDSTDDYDYRPVTALFTHVSDEVYNIAFDNGEVLGVTVQHPIYSVTTGGWRLAGELVVGEKVLTKSGEATVMKSSKKEGVETVYNLEVKDLHNFLVGEIGVVVHNNYTCFDALKELFKGFGITLKKVGGKSGAVRNGNNINLPDGRSVVINKKEMPDFAPFTKRTSSGTPLANEFPNLKGDVDRLFDNNLSNDWLINSGLLDEFDSYWINPTHGSPVKLYKNGVEEVFTWHHHENGKTMMLVEQAVHNSVQHIGGAALIKSGAVSMLDYDLILPGPVF